MKLETTLCTALAMAVAAGAGPVLAQQDNDRDVAASDRAESENLILTERRDELVLDADETLEQLRRENELGAELLDEAYGHAVFDTTKGGLILTGAGGTGVARASDGSDVTFMRLGAAGIGLGAGFESYKLVMLFADEETYSSFVAGQWDGALAAQAAAGSAGAANEEQFLGGVRVFRLTDGGLMAQIDVTALKFWPYDRLNSAVEIEEQIVAAAAGDVPVAIAERAAAQERLAEPASAGATQDARATQTRDVAPSNPERLDELAAEHEDLEIFVEAVKAAGLANALTGATEYTLFAPTNEAFESMSGMTREELLTPENRDELVRLLSAHIVADDLDREMAGNIPEALTIDGGAVRVDVEGEQFTVGNASVVQSDIEDGNLRVHVIDEVLSSPIQVAEADIESTALEDDVDVDTSGETADFEGAEPDGAVEPSGEDDAVE
jgi:uncharacterized surface protein with fasciclin (FAS1) repeats/lipid-binding SYLF domain-containing protein